MIQKDSYGFNTHTGVRLGEIQETEKRENFYWVSGELNVADLISRGSPPKDLTAESEWQKGPNFLIESKSKWPLEQKTYVLKELPEVIQSSVFLVNEQSSIPSVEIDADRFSNINSLIRTVARVLAVRSLRSLKAIKNLPNNEEVKQAWELLIRNEQKEIITDFRRGKFDSLGAFLDQKGIIMVGRRIEQTVPLVPKSQFVELLIKEAHEKGHGGVLCTASKVRTKVWVPYLLKLIKSVIKKCTGCKLFNKERAAQLMGSHTEERIKPSYPFANICIDLFGPYEVKDCFRKTIIKKVYAAIFTCLFSRAVYLDIVMDYSTEEFLQTFRRFVTIRGYPEVIYSDSGTQLVGANRQLQENSHVLSQKHLSEELAFKGIRWEFAPGCAPWRQACAESLIASVKKCLFFAIGCQILSVTEFQTVLFEAANLLNDRPIGRHPTQPEDGFYLSPNSLLLGRTTNQSVPFCYVKTTKMSRHKLVETIMNSFWKKWQQSFLPQMAHYKTWRKEQKNIQPGDVVLIEDQNAIRGIWKLGIVKNVYPGRDNLVRDVEVEVASKDGSKTLLSRPIQKLVIIVPKVEQH